MAEFVSWTVDEVTEACLEALATGRVDGVPMEADPEDLATRLAYPDRLLPGAGEVDSGGRPFEQRYFAHGRQMTRDWDLVTAWLSREHLRAPWACDGIVIRAHLLDEPPVWADVAAELERHGYGCVPGPDEIGGLREYTVTASNVSASVTTGDHPRVPPGRLHTVHVHPVVVPRPDADRRGVVRNAMRALGRAGPDARADWLAERRLTAHGYAGVFHALRVLKQDQPARRDEWSALHTWFLERAREAGVFRPEEWTYHRAQDDTVPPGEISAACLAALPMTRAEAGALPRGWRDTAPDDARRARMTRALLRLAADGAPDAAGAEELRRWRDELRRLTPTGVSTSAAIPSPRA
ncbi:hypothetical protein Val02_03350 [Virgisporangium aliadipatigenens]|uniref:Uncharacterized protein n=1 Tax=Virgisporangium aliadipatigenens TaxID=741659 RepID=A0A8J4DMJ5_9ACTN|nr:hypothetical protein [Virgisporangium aliadipatigenens]GIJ43449.1 hypothetical protein Val02_03350 [Virgisporangium aliadipatigenens]